MPAAKSRFVINLLSFLRMYAWHLSANMSKRRKKQKNKEITFKGISLQVSLLYESDIMDFDDIFMLYTCRGVCSILFKTYCCMPCIHQSFGFMKDVMCCVFRYDQ